jgi:hypothetical protein
MGTLIASLASLISFKYILRDFAKSTKKYIQFYSLLSMVYIIIISVFLILVF